MAIVKTVRADSRAGIAALERLERRGGAILDPKVTKKAASIVEAVRRGGDRELLEAVRKFDAVATGRASSRRAPSVNAVGDLRLTAERADRRELPPGFEHALERAIVAVERYHERQVHGGFKLADAGVELTEHRRPFERVGIYIPGGRATYPSSVVMTVVPAKLAGVQEIVIATPRSGFDRSPALRHAIERLGVNEVWAMGGAHAVAALAYGTETIRRVDKIVGPGNAWVTAAKHLVSAHVAIDSLAGPSEVLIVAAGDGVDPELVAADMLAQAEHDPQATALLLTDRPKLAKAVNKELRRQLKSLATAAVARESLRTRGLVAVVPDMETALGWTERIAPEHLQLVGAPAEALAEKVRNAGAVFVGENTPEVFGDYLAGPSHVLPTAGAARYSSALGVEDFIRRSHVIRFDAEAARRCSAAAANLAEVEGLPAHASAARLRGGGRSREP